MVVDMPSYAVARQVALLTSRLGPGPSMGQHHHTLRELGLATAAARARVLAAVDKVAAVRVVHAPGLHAVFASGTR